MRIVAHLLIAGRVQGVGYRAWTDAEASRRGIDGWVRNCADGAVEAVLAGDAQAVQDMIAACGRGPYFARVDSVVQLDAPVDPGPGFQTLPTAGERA